MEYQLKLVGNEEPLPSSAYGFVGARDEKLPSGHSRIDYFFAVGAPDVYDQKGITHRSPNPESFSDSKLSNGLRSLAMEIAKLQRDHNIATFLSNGLRLIPKFEESDREAVRVGMVLGSHTRPLNPHEWITLNNLVRTFQGQDTLKYREAA